MLSEALQADEAAALAAGMGLSVAELGHIEQALGRLPRRSELAVFAGMWSEHCAYKSSRHLLATLPRQGPGVLAGPGAHAGVVDIGDGWAVAFKVESHNHPSAVEPYQGAATGVGGIIRDIVAQGARPCALMDALFFGAPEAPGTAGLVAGVVAGVAGYGNAIGVANVGGMLHFDARYRSNILVNVLAAGLLRHDALRHGRARGVGNALLYVGARTGRDGVLGAAFASAALDGDTLHSRPHVQVGDPFAGKQLLEACLGFTAAAGLVACQDMGACGLTCAAAEMAAAGGVGVRLELDAVPLREAGMTAQEILLSESQERFLFVVEAGHEAAAAAHFEGFGVEAALCGRVVAGDRLEVRHAGRVLVDLPAGLVAGGAPPAAWPLGPPPAPPAAWPPFEVADASALLQRLMALPGVDDAAALYRHFDQSVGARTVRGPGAAAAAVLRLPASPRGFALALGGRGDVCAADAYLGAQAAVADVLRALACVGAPLVAVTDGLNLPSPEPPPQMRQVADTVRGLGDALRALQVPVTGGNVSLYNESPAGPIPPTPVVGGLGPVAALAQVPVARLRPGLQLLLLGQPGSAPAYSLFAALCSGVAVGGVPAVDLVAERRLADLLVAQVAHGRVAVALGCGRGGLAVALARLCRRGGTGATAVLPRRGRADWTLFGEYPAQVWVGAAAADAAAIGAAAEAAGVPAHLAGASGGSRLQLRVAGPARATGEAIDVDLTRLPRWGQP